MQGKDARACCPWTVRKLGKEGSQFKNCRGWLGTPILKKNHKMASPDLALTEYNQQNQASGTKHVCWQNIYCQIMFWRCFAASCPEALFISGTRAQPRHF